MRNRIFGGIGVLWGGAIVLRWLMSGSPAGSDAYEAGYSGAVIVGALLLFVGIYYLFKKP